MRDCSNDAPGHGWVRPLAQRQNIDILESIEYKDRPAVFGTSTPPSGLSGYIRRAAFVFSVSRWSHWLLLMFADHVNVVEGVLGDFGHGRPPHL